jgi:hypothetical protein
MSAINYVFILKYLIELTDKEDIVVILIYSYSMAGKERGKQRWNF